MSRTTLRANPIGSSEKDKPGQRMRWLRSLTGHRVLRQGVTEGSLNVVSSLVIQHRLVKTASPSDPPAQPTKPVGQTLGIWNVPYTYTSSHNRSKLRSNFLPVRLGRRQQTADGLDHTPQDKLEQEPIPGLSWEPTTSK